MDPCTPARRRWSGSDPDTWGPPSRGSSCRIEARLEDPPGGGRAQSDPRKGQGHRFAANFKNVIHWKPKNRRNNNIIDAIPLKYHCNMTRITQGYHEAIWKVSSETRVSEIHVETTIPMYNQNSLVIAITTHYTSHLGFVCVKLKKYLLQDVGCGLMQIMREASLLTQWPLHYMFKIMNRSAVLLQNIYLQKMDGILRDEERRWFWRLREEVCDQAVRRSE